MKHVETYAQEPVDECAPHVEVMHARMYVVFACVGFGVGVLVQNIPGLWYTQLAAVACIVVGVFLVTTARVWAVAVFVFLTAVVCGVYVYTQALARYTEDYDALYSNAGTSTPTYTGVVTSDRDERENAVVVDVLLYTHDGGAGNDMFTTAPKVRLYLPRAGRIAYADRVEVTGKVLPPKIITSPSTTIFDYPSYLRAQGIVGEMRFAKVKNTCEQHETHPEAKHPDVSVAEAKPLGGGGQLESVGCGKSFGERFFALLYALKHTYRDTVRAYMAEPYASLALGITIGEKHGLSKDEMDAFTQAGLSHVVVLSGYNISLLITLAFYLLALVPVSRGWVLGIGSSSALLFVLMTGASATAMRALVMALIAALGTYMYRSAVPLMSLLVVSTGLVMWNPFMLADDVSFQLSALATLGILLFGTTWSAWWTQRIGKVVGTTLGTTFAASIFTVPLVMHTFGTASVVAPVANVLVLPLIEPATLLTLASGVVGSVSMLPLHILGLVLAGVAQALLAIVFYIVTACAHIPYATVAAPLPTWAVCMWWCAVGVYAYAASTSEEYA